MGSRDETVASDSVEPRGLESRVLLQRARARLLGRDETLAFIGRYSVTHRIGWGGMGVVYAAHDPDLDRDVAIKVLRHDVDRDPRRQAWLLREAQALAKLNHPNVVQVYEVGKYDDHVFLAMELVEGRTLRAWVRADRPAWRDVVAHYLEAGRGLAAAHRAGVIHRDVKPDNLLLGSDGRVRMLDFGLAGLDPSASARASASASAFESTSHGISSDDFTAPGGISGTPSYMAPEQHAGGELDAASDQFAFCVSLWEALCGSPPYSGKNASELAEHKRRGPPPWPKHAPGNRALVDALRRGLAADPEARFSGMEALLSALAGAISHRRRNRIALAVGAVALVAGSTALASWRGAAPTPCGGAHEQLGDAWSPARRDASQQAFAATGLSYADRTWQRAAGTLDAYAAQWAEQHTDA
ncbi:MAG TPA: serine/threonine-protein kinase, partial [Nannocystaceae bacterium]|nr:serine/threonine-protein kinase [Nannocystaceae bacterium]